MSFIGDFVATYKLASKIRTEFATAPIQFKGISDDVRSLSFVLQDVEVVVPQLELTTEQLAELHDIAEGCRNILQKLNATLEEYRELDHNPKSFSGKARRVRMRLKWDARDIAEFRTCIVEYLTRLAKLNLYSQLSSAIKNGVDQINQRQDEHKHTVVAIKDGVDQLNQRQDEQMRRAITDWLTLIDYSTQQSDIISKWQEGTGQWLLESIEFLQWLNQTNHTLFCTGMPGAGKTILTSTVVRHLYSIFENDDTVGIAYLYCNFRRGQDQEPAELLTSLLKQLLRKKPLVPDYLKRLYQYYQLNGLRPTYNQILESIYSIIIGNSRTFIVIDALDECQVSNRDRKTFLSDIFNLQIKSQVSLFATSRFIPEIINEFKGSLSLEIRARDDDVRTYLDKNMFSLPLCILRDPTLQEQIKTDIVKFLLAQLHLDSLTDKLTPKAVKSTLEKLPKGSEAYDEAYKEAMKRIEGKKQGFRDIAKRVLSWITCAKRPLSMLELQHALAVEIGDPKIDPNNLLEVEDMVSACAGLVTIDQESDIIRLVHYTTQQYLVHYTTQQYFERNWITIFPNAQNDITAACITFLSFNELGFCNTEEEFKNQQRTHPLYDYASKNWGHHAHNVAETTQELILDFLSNERKISLSTQSMISRTYPTYHSYLPNKMTGLHVAAYFGLTKATMVLLEDKHNPHLRDIYGQTPVSWAAENGYEAVVKVLLGVEGISLDCRDNEGETPLSKAARNGHTALVRLLLAQGSVNPDSWDNDYQTPLSWAAERGHEAVVKLLLAENVNPNSQTFYLGETPLSWAAWKGHEAVVKLLLAHDGTFPNPIDNDGYTPLSSAAENGHEAIVKLLLAEDCVDSWSKDVYGGTPLSRAAANGHEAIVNLLMAIDFVDLD
ncbi:hypothetical protein V494_06771 [Pseudogymnoascus sp. VKM F-4513 (FW-928)]|nr:hypothetical protein V494_06771 [Pseudogymnoascus sp. VKM F-4513 (FW-928)]